MYFCLQLSATLLRIGLYSGLFDTCPCLHVAIIVCYIPCSGGARLPVRAVWPIVTGLSVILQC